MNLSDLENHINFSLISDVNNKKKRIALENRVLANSLSKKSVNLGGLHYFVPEMLNGKVVLEEQPCYIMNSQLFKKFMQLLADRHSDEFYRFCNCLNDLVNSSSESYHYLSTNGSYHDSSVKFKHPPLISYYILKKYGEKSELWKLFDAVFHQYTQRLIIKSQELNLSLVDLWEWALKDENIALADDILDPKDERIFSNIISLQWIALDNWKFKIDLNISFDFDEYYGSRTDDGWLIGECFGDLYSSLVLFEMKANKIVNKGCYLCHLEDLSFMGDGVFVTDDSHYSLFNFTENVTIYFDHKRKEMDITDFAERNHFLYEMSDNEHFNYFFDDGDLVRLAKNIELLNILDDIVVI